MLIADKTLDDKLSFIELNKLIMQLIGVRKSF